MKIETTRFGAIEVSEESIVEFPEGLLGLHDYHKYVLIDRPSSPLRWMQSMELPDLAFLVADPQIFMADYRAEVGANELSTIGEVDPRNLAVGVICTVPGDVSDATVNLKAPLVVDIQSRRGKQIVLNDSPYSIHHPFAGMAQAAA